MKKALILAALCGFAGCREAPSQKAPPDFVFPSPTAETRPWGICHWLGNAIEPDDLADEMRRWSDAGLGGIRIVPLYGVNGEEARCVKFMSPRFVELLKTAKTQAAERGMGVDLSFGAGWCFGGAAVTPELGVQRLLLVKSGKRLPKGSRVLHVRKDGTRLVASTPGALMVKRTQPLDAGPMINPFSPAAMKAHLSMFAPLDGDPATTPRAAFHDSFEYYGAAWSPEFPELFSKYRGYRIEDHYAELAGEGSPDAVARVKCDYRETLSDILSKDVFPLWTRWCRERGIQTHNQAHGAPGDLLAFYAIADTPETEMFGRGKRDPLKSGFDAKFREGDRDTLMSKFASSAAHLAGRRHVAAEAFTWIAEHFCETLEETKAFGDLLFLSGVTRLYCHATVYSPRSAPWPGWCFYASGEYNPRNPVWRDIKPLFDYFTRVQSLLAAAEPDNDVLLYWPLHDLWSSPDAFAVQLPVHSHWMRGTPFGKLAARLRDAGYSFDYASDPFLDAKTVSRYKAIVVPECRYMKAATLAKLKEFASTTPVIFEKAFPVSEPGLRGEPLDCAGLGAPAADAVEALRKTNARRDAFASAKTPFDALRLRWNGGRLYFIVNSSVAGAKLLLPADAVVMNPLTGETAPAPATAAGGADRALHLHPAASCFVWTKDGECGIWPEKGEKVSARGRTIALDGKWSLEFKDDVSGWELPAKREGAVLGDWTKFGEKEAEFSGSAIYKTTFNLGDGAVLAAGAIVSIDLGEVWNSAKIRINGSHAATVFMHPYKAFFPASMLKPGENAVEIETTNLGANRIRAYDRRGVKWKYFGDLNVASIRYKPLDASSWPVLPSGLAGPVKLSIPDACKP